MNFVGSWIYNALLFHLPLVGRSICMFFENLPDPPRRSCIYSFMIHFVLPNDNE